MKTMYAHKETAFSSIQQYRKEGLSLRVIARKLGSAGYVNMKGYRVQQSDIGNFLTWYKNQPVTVPVTRKTATPSFVPSFVTESSATTEMREVLASNLSAEAKLKFISTLVG